MNARATVRIVIALLALAGSAWPLSAQVASDDWCGVGVNGEDEMPLTDAMRSEYTERFATCAVRPERRAEVEGVITRMLKARGRYEKVTAATLVPWHVVAIIHNMECSGDFRCHLHNGDPLRARTVQVPKGRPVIGDPPFSWEESAIDALGYDGFDVWTDWSIAGTLFKFETFNGMGYRKRGVPSPYLWSASQHYVRGKYASDGRFDPQLISKQIGAAVLLRRMHDQALIELGPIGTAKCVGVQ